METDATEECKPHPELEFQNGLTRLLNEHGYDAKLSMPDYILCNYLMDSLRDLTNLKVSLLQHQLGVTRD